MAPWALLSAYECSQVLTIAHKCSQCIGTMFNGAEECSLVLMGAHETPLTLMIIAPWTLLSTNEPSWSPLSAQLIGSHDQSSAHALLSMVPWHSEQFWALMSTQDHCWCHGNFLLTDPLGSKMHLIAYECSRLLLSTHDCSSACLKNKWNVDF